MKFEITNGVIRGLPVAILVTVLVQGATAIWWVSAKAQETNYIARRVEQLEGDAAGFSKAQGAVIERLARIEERLAAQLAVLERIEKRRE